MTGYKSKRAAAQAKTIDQVNWADHELDDDDTQVYHDDALTIAYQSGYYDGKKAAAQEQKPMHPQLKAMLEEYFDKCFAESSTQRPWVGLTEKDFSAINQSCLTKLQAATSAESILKERNHG